MNSGSNHNGAPVWTIISLSQWMLDVRTKMPGLRKAWQSGHGSFDVFGLGCEVLVTSCNRLQKAQNGTRQHWSDIEGQRSLETVETVGQQKYKAFRLIYYIIIYIYIWIDYQKSVWHTHTLTEGWQWFILIHHVYNVVISSTPSSILIYPDKK